MDDNSRKFFSKYYKGNWIKEIYSGETFNQFVERQNRSHKSESDWRRDVEIKKTMYIELKPDFTLIESAGNSQWNGTWSVIDSRMGTVELRIGEYISTLNLYVLDHSTSQDQRLSGTEHWLKTSKKIENHIILTRKILKGHFAFDN